MKNMSKDFDKSSEGKDKGKKTRQKSARIKREEFGDPSEIGAFMGPWRNFLNSAKMKEDSVRIREELSLGRVVNKHCLIAGKERTKRVCNTLMDSYSDLSRPSTRKFIVPKNNVALFHEHKDLITSAKLFKKFQLALSSSLDGRVCLYSLNKDKGLLKTYMGHSKAVMSTITSTDEMKLWTISLDNFLKGWDIETGKCSTRINCGSPLTCQTASKMSGVIYVGGVDGKVKQIDTREKKMSSEIAIEGSGDTQKFSRNSIFSICIAEECYVLAFSKRDGTLHFMDVREERVLKVCNRRPYPFIEFNEGKKVFTVVCDENAEYFDATTLLEDSIGVLQIQGCCTEVKSSEDGDVLCYGCLDGIIRTIDCKSKEVCTIGITGERICSIDWIWGSAPNLISGDILGNIKIWS